MNIRIAPGASAELDQCQANMRHFFEANGVDFDDPAICDAIGTAFCYLAHAIGDDDAYEAAGASVLALRWA